MESGSSIEKIDECQYKVHVKLPVDEVSSAVASKLKEIARNVKMKGFRAGKVPMSIVRNTYAGEIVSRILNEKFAELFFKTIAEQDFHMIRTPELLLNSDSVEYLVSMSSDKGSTENKVTTELSATFSICGYPSLVIKDYFGLSLDVPYAEINDAAVDMCVERISLQHGSDVEVTDRVDVQVGDKIIYDAKLHVDDTGSQEQVSINDGAITDATFQISQTDDVEMLSAFAKGVIGARVEEVVGVKCVRCENDSTTNVSEHKQDDVERMYDVCVKKILKRVPCEVNDELAKRVLGVDSVEDLRSRIKDMIKDNQDKILRDDSETKILELLREKNPFDVPRAAIDAEMRSVLKREGVVKSDFDSNDFWNEDISLHMQQEDFVATIKTRVHDKAIIKGIIKQEDVKVTQKECNDALANFARSVGVSIKSLEKYFSSDDMRKNVASNVLYDKVIDLLISKANITKTKIDASSSVCDYLGE